jgi:hypothetical protein
MIKEREKRAVRSVDMRKKIFNECKKNKALFWQKDSLSIE